jgi:hypothetical protein
MKQKVLTLAVGLSCAVLISGCATLFGGGSKQSITINSQTPQENVSIGYLSDDNSSVEVIQTFNTPTTVTIPRENKNLMIRDKDGNCEEKRVEKELNSWFWGDVLMLSLLSTTVDAVTGAMWEYDNNVTIECR